MAAQRVFPIMAKKKTEESGNGSPAVRATRPAPPRRRPGGPTLARGGNGDARQAPTHAQIAEAAYLRYLNRGAQDGRDFDDWVEAERDLQLSRAE
jgi:hypothetical protein